MVMSNDKKNAIPLVVVGAATLLISVGILVCYYLNIQEKVRRFKAKQAEMVLIWGRAKADLAVEIGRTQDLQGQIKAADVVHVVTDPSAEDVNKLEIETINPDVLTINLIKKSAISIGKGIAAVLSGGQSLKNAIKPKN